MKQPLAFRRKFQYPLGPKPTVHRCCWRWMHVTVYATTLKYQAR